MMTTTKRRNRSRSRPARPGRSRLTALLGIFLALTLLPFASGCSWVLTAGDDVVAADSNAYTCECSCGAGPRPRALGVMQSDGDASEARNNGRMDVDGDRLVLGGDLVALRFPALPVPAGALVTEARVRFTAAASDGGTTQLDIGIENDDDAPPLTAADGSISGRTTLGGSVDWSVPAWTAGESGPDQTTPDLAGLIQGVVDLGGWSAGNALVLIFDGGGDDRVAVSFDGNPLTPPVLELTYVDPSETTAAQLRVCLPDARNPSVNEDAPDPDEDLDGDGLPDVLVEDCEGRVENSFRGMVGACGYFQDPVADCECELAPSGVFDSNDNQQLDETDEPYYGFVASACFPPDGGDEVCPGEELSLPTCSNFDPVGFSSCAQPILAGCAQVGIPPEDCDIGACTPLLAATHAPGDAPVCSAYAADGLSTLAFELMGRRSTCRVGGLSEIEIGDEGREPKKDPSTVGALEIWGEPCPGESCPVGLAAYALGMNPITFDVKFSRDPTFRDLIQTGDSLLGAARIDAAGEGVLPGRTALSVSRGRRGSDRRAVEAENGGPVDLDVDWIDATCSLAGDLTRTVDAEDAEGVCAGDDGATCRADPDCDAVGGPCELPEEDPEPLSVQVALAGDLVNQPPHADAGPAQSVECTSPAGAAFVLDGRGSGDPDGNLAIASWREGVRTGPEIGFDLAVGRALGLGDSRQYVLRVIDAFAQSDEDTTSVEVVDTTPPVIACNAPATVLPTDGLDEDEPQAEPATFTATAVDTCDPAVGAAIVGFDCYATKGKDRRIDKTESCAVDVAGDTVRILDTGGVGTRIRWTVEAGDASGNTATTDCEVEVVRR